jgi:hypothetical protein
MNKDELKTLAVTEFTFGDTPFRFGEISLSAAIYLVAYGAKQSAGDSAAAYASFVGVTDGGEVPSTVLPPKKRNAIAKDLAFYPYNDADMVQRRELADAYFAKALANKWSRIQDGSLTVDSRGRLGSDDAAMMGFAERDLIAWVGAKGTTKAKVIAKRRESRAELADATDAAVWKSVIADFLEQSRGDYEAELADAKAKAKANAERLSRDGFML